MKSCYICSIVHLVPTLPCPLGPTVIWTNNLYLQTCSVLALNVVWVMWGNLWWQCQWWQCSLCHDNLMTVFPISWQSDDRVPVIMTTLWPCSRYHDDLMTAFPISWQPIGQHLSAITIFISHSTWVALMVSHTVKGH